MSARKKNVVLISGELDEFTETDMRRWWHNHCKKHVVSGETFFEVQGRLNLYGGVERLASFGVSARVARRAVNEGASS
jgi:hypothetical protein